MKHTLYIGALVLALAVTACGQTGPLVAPKARDDGQPKARNDGQPTARNDGQRPASEDAPPGSETSQDSELTADPDFSSEESDD